MDPATKQDIEQLKADLVELLVEQSETLLDQIAATQRALGVMIEDTQKQVSAVADLVQRDDEKMENHEKRIGRLEDHTGLPALEPAIGG